MHKSTKKKAFTRSPRLPNPTKKKGKAKKTAAAVVAAAVVNPVNQTFEQLLRQAFESGSPVVGNPHAEMYSDARGDIINVVTKPVGSVVLITCKPNTVRANHWHREDAHLCYVVSGSVHYYERPLGSKLDPTYTLIKAGESFITGPNVEHAMKFTEETVFLTLGKLSRTPAEYESDLVRLTEPLARPSVFENTAPVTPPTEESTAPSELNATDSGPASTPTDVTNSPPAEA